MSHSDGDEHVCGQSTYNDNFVSLSFSFPHYGQAVKVHIETTLDQASDDESWGIANFLIETSMDDCTDIAYSSDFTSDLQEGWEIENANLDNVTTCNECVCPVSWFCD